MTNLALLLTLADPTSYLMLDGNALDDPMTDTLAGNSGNNVFFADLGTDKVDSAKNELVI